MCRCVPSRCFTVTLIADPHLAPVRAIIAPVRRHPSCQFRRSASHAARGSQLARYARKLKNKVFCVGSFVFNAGFFCFCVFLHRPHGLAQDSSPPFVVPSEDHSHEGGLGARLFREGRRTKDAQQSRKKKHMKTTSQKNQVGLKSKSAQLSSTNTNTAAAGAVAPAPAAKPDNRLPRLLASGFGFRSASSPRPPSARRWRSWGFTGIASASLGSIRAASSA